MDKEYCVKLSAKPLTLDLGYHQKRWFIAYSQELASLINSVLNSSAEKGDRSVIRCLKRKDNLFVDITVGYSYFDLDSQSSLEL